MKDKRFVVVIGYYEYAENEEKAYQAAIKRTSKMNKRLDCRAEVREMRNAPFGKIGQNTLIELEPLQDKYGKGHI